MTCTLTIENVASLTSGDPVVMALNEHGLSIGRAAHADWTLPDPRNIVSSLHCDIDFVDGQYVLNDRSTNGTFVNGGNQRLNAPYVLRDGDLIRIASYEVRVALGGSSSRGGQNGSGGFEASAGLDWLAVAGGGSAPIDARQFGREAAKPLFQTSNDPLMAGFAPPPPVAAAPDPFGMAAGAPAADPFGLTGNAAPRPNPFGLAPGAAPPMPAAAPAIDPFGLSAPAPAAAAFPSAMPAPAAPSFGNPFGVASGNAPDPFGVGGGAPTFAPPAPAAAPPADNPWAKLHAFDTIDFGAAATTAVEPAPAATPALASAPVSQAPASQATPGSDGGQAYAQFLAAAGLKPGDMEGVSATQVLEAAGRLLRQATDGLIRLLDARTRVRHQFGVGAQVTRFQAQGNNPLKWTRVPEQALRQLVGEPDRGFLGGTQAVQGAFEDLQAHEVAMLAAMQEALAATVQRFSPEAIKARAQGRGGILPGAKEAALWRAFETEYRALAAESDAAYLDLFARHFRTAYERNVKKD